MKLYNTLTRQTEDFQPQNAPTVNLYTCGPTVYNFAHIGNLRYFIFADVLRRALEVNDYKVNHVMNITDVGHLTSDSDEGEDKLEKGAAREGKTVWDVVKLYTDAFLQDVDQLNIKRATHIAPATDYIEKQIEMITHLEDKGFTYTTDQAVYFDTAKLEDYGKLTGQKLEEKQTSREKIVQDPQKKRQHDFALWFFTVGRYREHTMHWASPWGDGFPGWHIECSAINWQFFPDGTDIHTGGIDHIPVHHTNEIAQYEAALDRPMAKYWMHGNFLVLDPLMGITLSNNRHLCPHCGNMQLVKTKKDYIQNKQKDGILLMVKCDNCGKVFSGSIKMAKSGENFITLQTLLDKGFDPLAYRYFVLQAHYRSELQFSWEALEAAQNALRSLRHTARTWGKPKSNRTEYEKKFLDAINDDLNTPRALSIIWDLVKSEYSSEEKAHSLLQMDIVLGLQLNQYVNKTVELPEDIRKLKEERDKARAEGNYAKSDELRNTLTSLGTIVKDTPQGTVVYVKDDKSNT